MRESTKFSVSLGVMIIEAKDIRKGFGKLEVLKGVDFSVRKAEIVSIVGASGAGKTTLLQILGTLLRPDGGSLVIDGYDTLRMNEKQLSAFRCRKIGFVFQAHHLLPEFSALENVMMPALIAGRKTIDAKRSALELLGRVGLSERVKHRPSELSGGEQQRTAIAKAAKTLKIFVIFFISNYLFKNTEPSLSDCQINVSVNKDSKYAQYYQVCRIVNIK